MTETVSSAQSASAPMTNPPKKDTIPMHYLNLLRILGCILVVLVHVSAYNQADLAFPSAECFVNNAYSHLALLGVPLFVMISGCIMLSPDYAFSYRKLLTKKIPRLILVYFFWLVLYNLMNCYQEGYGYSLSSIKEHVILNSLLGKGIYHLWFLPMIIGLYFVTPVLRRIVTDKRLCFYCLLLYFIGVIFFPTILKFEFRFKTIVESLYNRIPYRMLTGYLGYYMLGYALHAYVPKLTKKKRIAARLTGLLFCCAGFTVSYFRAVGRGVFSQILNDPFTVNDFVAVTCLFLLGKACNDFLQRRSRACVRIKKLAGLTMGIYLVHPAILMVCQWNGLNTLFLPQIVSVPLCLAAVLLLSAAISAVLKMIPGVRRLLL